MMGDGGGGISTTTGLATLPGEGVYAWDASTNAIFYGADGIPTHKAMLDIGGGTNYLTAGPSEDWDFGTGAFTLEMWVKFAQLNRRQSCRLFQQT